MTEHNGPDGPSNDRTGSDAVNTPEPPASQPTPGEDTPAEGTPGEDTPGEDTPGEDTPAEDTLAEGTGTSAAHPEAARPADAARPGPAEPETTAQRESARPAPAQSGTARPDTHGDPADHPAPADHPGAPSGVGVFDLGADGLGGDELALRRLLQGAVGGLEPAPGTLDHLRRAVPARRARKRQALVGAAAAVILLGTGIPAFVHVAASDTASDANPVNAGHGEQVQGGTGDAAGPAGEEAAGSPSGELNGSGKGGANPSGTPTSAGTSASDGADGTPDNATSAPATAPECEAGQLGVSVAEAGGPGGDGTVYGTFRIANVSSSDCTVSASGTVGFGTSGAADAGRISVVRHTAGDAASGLPGPSATVGSLVLKPSGAYEVKFAWVPSETCSVHGGGGTGGGDGGGGGEQSPTPTAPSTPTEEPPPPTDGASTGTAEGGTDTATAAEPQLMPREGTADGSVTVTHTPSVGGPQAATTIPNACAGTIYRTGLLPG
ncbi:hypothetical protein [Streptomyces sp. enrichment culture]|uniref:hypothetical protein n=1 Tax=Streptomyces sp. enrichment culture TaxID=1795815 RepID=UPI003F55F12C